MADKIPTLVLNKFLPIRKTNGITEILNMEMKIIGSIGFPCDTKYGKAMK